MSTIRFNGLTLQGASYLIRMDVDLGPAAGAHLRIRDIDVHVLARIQNQSADELTHGAGLVGRHTLDIRAYGDANVTHRFEGIEFSGRLAVRTPQLKMVLLKFRFPVTVQPGGGPGLPGWADVAMGTSRVKTRYPAAHNGGAIYPPVHLQPGAAVHRINLAGPNAVHDPDEIIAFAPRQLLGFSMEDHPDVAGDIKPVKLGLDSYRTNSCRWLDMTVHQDAHWRAYAAGNVPGNIAPIELTITSPTGNQPLELNLENMAGGQLIYTEASNELAAAMGLIDVGGQAEDGWELFDGAAIPGVTLAPISLSHLRKLVPLSARELALGGMQQGVAGPDQPPVERVILKFATPNPPGANLAALRT